MRHFMKSLVVLTFLAFAFNFSSMAQEKEEVACDGYCPVAYKMMDKAVKGKAEYAVKHDGETYYLLKAKAQKAFKKNPEKFKPKYSGYCATGMAKGKKLESKGKLFVLHEGKTYLFSSKKARKMFKKNPEKYIEKADEQYAEMQG